MLKYKEEYYGTYVLSSGYYDAYYLKAQKVRKLLKMILMKFTKKLMQF